MNNKRPFGTSLNQLKKLGASDLEAVQTIQIAVNRFTDKNNEIKKRIDEQASDTARELNGKLVTLATLLITVTGVFITQKSIYITLTDLQKAVIIIIFLSLIFSIVFGVIDYFQAGKFFTKWQDGAREVSRLVDKEISEGKIQKIGEIYAIESSIMKNLPSSSGDGFLKFQLGSSIIGTLCFVLVIASFLYDLPFIK